MTISAQIIADSMSSFHIQMRDNARLTTFLVRYPRFIHSEVMTHRVFSRNASSSRAIPIAKLIADVLRDPAMPVHWGRKQSGMQAREEHDALVPLDWFEDGTPNPDCTISREEAWLEARDAAVRIAESFDKAGYHKQIVNRLLEPFCHITVLITSSTFSNFFALRRHADAQPEIRALADAMWDAYSASTPEILRAGEWHLPFLREEDKFRTEEAYDDDGTVVKTIHQRPVEDLLKVSTARAARTSYFTHEGKLTSFDDDVALFSKLMIAEPLHASPAEHQATPTEPYWGVFGGVEFDRNLGGNFGPGWCQHRKMFPNENVRAYAAEPELV